MGLPAPEDPWSDLEPIGVWFYVLYGQLGPVLLPRVLGLFNVMCNTCLGEHRGCKLTMLTLTAVLSKRSIL